MFCGECKKKGREKKKSGSPKINAFPEHSEVTRPPSDLGQASPEQTAQRAQVRDF